VGNAVEDDDKIAAELLDASGVEMALLTRMYVAVAVVVVVVAAVAAAVAAVAVAAAAGVDALGKSTLEKVWRPAAEQVHNRTEAATRTEAPGDESVVLVVADAHAHFH
jgi:DNA-binding LytR/AlgR family response regulator